MSTGGADPTTLLVLFLFTINVVLRPTTTRTSICKTVRIHRTVLENDV